MNEVPIAQKYALTVNEAIQYFGIGEHSLRRLIDNNRGADWLFRIGNKTMIKRGKLEQLLDKVDSI